MVAGHGDCGQEWSDVGGDAGEFVLVSREDGSGARILFEERVMGSDHVSLTAVVLGNEFQDELEELGYSEFIAQLRWSHLRRIDQKH